MSKFNGTVIVFSNQKENLARLSKEYPNIQTICIDLLDWDATRAAVKNVLPIDLLVNNAGILHSGDWLKTTSKDFDSVIGVNVKAIFNICQVVAESMIERKIKCGSIVNVSSQAGIGALKDSTIYCMSKAAVNMLTK